MENMRFNRNIVECKLELAHQKSLEVPGFNRNIVECKSIPVMNWHQEKLGFNRNIVECKFAILERQRSACFKF